MAVGSRDAAHALADERGELRLRRRRAGPDALAVDEQRVRLAPGEQGLAVRRVHEPTLDEATERRGRAPRALEGQVLRRAPAVDAARDDHLSRDRLGPPAGARRPARRRGVARERLPDERGDPAPICAPMAAPQSMTKTATSSMRPFTL